ncbi:hypothetical protein Q31b_41560 [Novipirellula aureliae]|uniref:Uncharacterized protein n=2 Tax=Novipirellula aureliae TaxID=2527966 RepID=A0A5C6DSB8_9BACT|nr:hypothetical protein Q31b_41560 [Novipirellula aureliae]
MLLPIGLSICILTWAFSLPMRHAVAPNQENDLPATPVNLSPRQIESLQREREAERFREAALRADAAWMQKRREKERLRRTRPLPDAAAANDYQQTHFNSVRAKIVELADAEPGSLEWQYRRDLEDSLDQPQ